VANENPSDERLMALARVSSASWWRQWKANSAPTSW